MGLVTAVLHLALLLSGFGFAVQALWVAAVVMVLWLLGFVVRGAEGSASTGGEPERAAGNRGWAPRFNVPLASR
jgi:hypothetical protein